MMDMKPLETVAEPGPGVADRVFSPPQVDIVVPVKDEERDLGPSVRRLRAFLRDELPVLGRASRSPTTAAPTAPGPWPPALAGELAAVTAPCTWTAGAGPGAARHLVGSDADVLAYMDVDLSTDLNALLPLVAPLLSGHSDLAIGTRLARGARVVRGPAPRGHLAQLQPAAAGHAGRRVQRRPVRVQGHPRATRPARCCRCPRTPGGSSTPSCWSWPSGPGCASTRCRSTGSTTPTRGSTSSPPPWPTCAASSGSASGCSAARSRCRAARLGRRGVRGHRRAVRAGPARPGSSPRFAAIGVASTVAYLLLFLLLRSVMPAQAANALSLLVTAIANTAANRRLTFGIRGRRQAAQHQIQGLIAFGIGFGADHRRAGRAARGHRRPGPGGRARRAGGGQPGRHRGCGSCCTAAGCSAGRAASPTHRPRPLRSHRFRLTGACLDRPHHPAEVSRRAAEPPRGRMRRLLQGPATDPALGPPGPARAAGPDRVCCT